MSLRWPFLKMASRSILLFVRNFNMPLVGLETLVKEVKVQVIRTIVCVEALHQFDLLSTDVGGTISLTVETIILGLASYFPPYELATKAKAPYVPLNEEDSRFKVRRYADYLTDLNEYLDSLPGSKLSKKLASRS